ncbi:MAG: hypothetical protein U5N85_08370 [Arcicella sp.]|nr:hypothetical protein [Arcicella sp.]
MLCIKYFCQIFGKKVSCKSILVIFFVLGIFFVSKFFNVDDVFGLIVDGLSESDQVEGESSGSAYLTGVYPQKLTDLLYYMPLQGFYFLFSPMLWDVSKIEQLISSLFSLIMLILLYQFFATKDSFFLPK